MKSAVLGIGILQYFSQTSSSALSLSNRHQSVDFANTAADVYLLYQISLVP